MTPKQMREMYRLAIQEPDSYGFKWGNACVQRLASDANGCRIMRVITPRGCLEMEITPSGLIKVLE